MALMTQLAKLRDSFDKHWYTLIASTYRTGSHSCVVIIHPDWLIRPNFRLRRSDKFA